MSERICPSCENHLNRSHTHGLKERFIKRFTPYRAYRCMECGWRGWLQKDRTSKSRVSVAAVISFIVTTLLTIALAFFFIARIG